MKVEADQKRLTARRKRRQLEARMMQGVMASALAIVIGSLMLILVVIIVRGLPAISWQMLTDVPHGAANSTHPGGIFNSIVGSLALGIGATLLALLLGLPIALYLNAYKRHSRFAYWVRLSLDVMWGIPSLLYGAFAFAIMFGLGLRASLLAGILTLSVVELPIMARGLGEGFRVTPRALHHGPRVVGAAPRYLPG